MQCVVYAVHVIIMLQYFIVSSLNLLIVRYGLAINGKCAIYTRLCCCLCFSSIQCKQHISLDVSVFHTAHSLDGDY